METEPDYKSIYLSRKVRLDETLSEIDRLFKKIIEPDARILFSHIKTSKSKKYPLFLSRKQIEKIESNIKKVFDSRSREYHKEMAINWRYQSMVRAYTACMTQGYRQFEEIYRDLDVGGINETLKEVLRSDDFQRIVELAGMDETAHPKFQELRKLVSLDSYFQSLRKIVFLDKKSDIAFFQEYYRKERHLETAALPGKSTTKKKLLEEEEICRKFASGEIKTIWSAKKTTRKFPEPEMVVYYAMPSKKENSRHLKNSRPGKHVLFVWIDHELDFRFFSSLMGYKRRKKGNENQSKMDFSAHSI